VDRVWLEPDVSLPERVAAAIRAFDAVVIGPGSFYTSLLPIFLVQGRATRSRRCEGRSSSWRTC
jgi:2-phospho-L-lactate transferase/gluconeogenesis factor (CofD/UPF0052 family)